MKPIASRRARCTRAVVAALAVAAAGTAVPSADAAVRVSPNILMLPDRNPVHGRDALGLAVNPRNPRHIVAVYADWHSLWCEVAMTRNAGRTWRKSRLKAPEGFVWPPCTVGGHLSGQLDQSIAFGRGGNVYTTFSSAVVLPNGDFAGQSALVAKSTDGGRSFGTGRVVLRGGESSTQGPEYILPKLAVDPARRRGGEDRIYVVAGESEQDANRVVQERTVLTVSRDGGATWSPRRVASPADQNAIEQSQPAIGKGGVLHVAWRERGRGTRPGQHRPEGAVVVGTSRDGGATWETEKVAEVRGYVYEGPPTPPFAAGGSFTASTFPRLVADRRRGRVYLAYGDAGARAPGSASASDHFIHPDMDVYFQRSGDGGDTWSPPRRMNGEPEVQTESITQTRHPNLAVARNGRVDLAWHDRRHWYRGCTHTHTICDEARLGDTYYRHSDDGGRSFSRDRRVTDRSINNDVGFDYRFGTYWDFGPFVVPRGRDRALIGWMDSRLGNPDTDTQSLFLAEVDHDAPKRVPVERLRARSADRFAVGMSQRTFPGGGESVLAGTFASRPFTRVVIVNRRDAASALAGGVLARAFVGPVLLTGRGGMSAATRAELARLAPVGAFVVGGTNAVSDTVVAQLAAAGIPREEIRRLAGADRAATARLIAEAADRRTDAQRREGRAAFDAAILVNPNSRDAYAASVLAANRRLPVLMTGRDELPAATAEALRSLGITRTLLVGSRREISSQLAAQVPRPQRLGGSNAYRTSRAVIAESRRRPVPDNIVYSVDSRRSTWAALLGATAGRAGGVLLLTQRGGHGPRRAVARMDMNDRVDRIVVARRR